MTPYQKRMNPFIKRMADDMRLSEATHLKVISASAPDAAQRSTFTTRVPTATVRSAAVPAEPTG